VDVVDERSSFGDRLVHVFPEMGGVVEVDIFVVGCSSSLDAFGQSFVNVEGLFDVDELFLAVVVEERC
jgi:hypothetical protein